MLVIHECAEEYIQTCNNRGDLAVPCHARYE